MKLLCQIKALTATTYRYIPCTNLPKYFTLLRARILRYHSQDIAAYFLLLSQTQMQTFVEGL